MLNFLSSLVKITKEHPTFFLVILLFVVVPFFIPIEWDKITIVLAKMPVYESAFFYVLLLIISCIIAPLNTLIIIPFAASVFGWFPAALLSITGWVIGALIAFIIARYLGGVLNSNFLEKIKEKTKDVPEMSTFWGLVLLRIIIPIDLLSYAVGFFTNMKVVPYTIATLIGVTPFAFIFTYAAAAAFDRQYMTLLISAGIGVIFFVFIFLFYKQYKKL